MLDLQQIRKVASIYKGSCSSQDVADLCDEVERLRRELTTAAERFDFLAEHNDAATPALAKRAAADLREALAA
ncbi:hypothetical protein [Azospirillum sp.]|uniref:hypothetical protein n=1 Tax=Azospirillum sp. TaxID=34012 RepID=UPI003D73A336